jgi:hypothetical protein
MACATAPAAWRYSLRFLRASSLLSNLAADEPTGAPPHLPTSSHIPTRCQHGGLGACRISDCSRGDLFGARQFALDQAMKNKLQSVRRRTICLRLIKNSAEQPGARVDPAHPQVVGQIMIMGQGGLPALKTAPYPPPRKRGEIEYCGSFAFRS